MFGSCAIGLMYAVIGESAGGALALQAATLWWMLHGAKRLNQSGWRASHGRDGTVWIVKDSLALVIWPILCGWIARQAEME
jgi:hypothetical protein